MVSTTHIAAVFHCPIVFARWRLLVYRRLIHGPTHVYILKCVWLPAPAAHDRSLLRNNKIGIISISCCNQSFQLSTVFCCSAMLTLVRISFGVYSMTAFQHFSLRIHWQSGSFSVIFTRNAWQSLAYSLLGAVVCRPIANTCEKHLVYLLIT